MPDKDARITELRLLLYDAIDKGDENTKICRISEELDKYLVDAFLLKNNKDRPQERRSV